MLFDPKTRTLLLKLSAALLVGIGLAFTHLPAFFGLTFSIVGFVALALYFISSDMFQSTK